MTADQISEAKKIYDSKKKSTATPDKPATPAKKSK